MKRHPLFIFAILILSFFYSNIEAQVTGIKYRLIYDVERDEHDFYQIKIETATGFITRNNFVKNN